MDGRKGRKIPKRYKHICNSCEKEFLGLTHQRFCSESCKGKFKYLSGKVTTRSQYATISGNWFKYFQRIINSKPERREYLTPEILLSVLENQNYKCALTGIELTCQLEAGFICKTNATIDRIEAGGLYIPENIQLVCKAVNSFRNNLSVEEFIWWCRKVVENAE